MNDAGRRPDTCERPDAASDPARVRRVPAIAGKSPHDSVAVAAQSNEYATIRQSSPISSTRGKSLASTRKTRAIAAASPSPRPAPAIASRKTSVSNCAATEARDAPRLKRTAISCCRPAARESSSAAILVQAISSSRVTDPNTTHSDCRTPPTVCSLSGWIPGRICASGFGNSRARSACTVSRSARACVSVAPDFSRPTPRNQVRSRLRA